MTVITDIKQLSLPEQYKHTLSFIISRLHKFPVVRDAILFGSCARQDATRHSDIDLALVVDKPLSPEEEWDIDNSIRDWDTNLPCDIIFIPAEAFEQEVKGESIIRPILREGVQLSGLLHQRGRTA